MAAPITRRGALALAGAAALGATLGPASASEGFTGVLGAAQNADGGWRIGTLDRELAGHEGASAPLRLHALCPRPDGMETVAMARRPGDLALVLDGDGHAARASFRASEGRRFAGHGVFRDGGARFLTAEIEVATGAGVIVVRDAAHGYEPLMEFGTAGLGPHELVGAGGLIAVANGAKEPKNDPGVAVLETTRARSNLALISPETGEVDRVAELDGLETLSLRHLARLPDGGVLVAAQDREPFSRDRPLIARLDGARLRPLDEALEVTPRLAAYVGSIAVDRSARFAAASSPKGGVVAMFDLSDGSGLGVVAAADVCGLVADTQPGFFIATTGFGEALRIAVHDGGCAIIERRLGTLRWDNHLAAVVAPA